MNLKNLDTVYARNGYIRPVPLNLDALYNFLKAPCGVRAFASIKYAGKRRF